MDLEVVGRHALLFDDDAIAAFVNSGDALVEWHSLQIDRYDVRHLLSAPPPPRRRNRNSEPILSDDPSLESRLDQERYIDLPLHSDQTEVEEDKQPSEKGGYCAVAFSYGETDYSADQKKTDAEMESSGFLPPFPIPENLLQSLMLGAGRSTCDLRLPYTGTLFPFDVMTNGGAGGIRKPPTEKVHQIIARTAMFVSKHGGQSEIILRVKQGDNPTFGFLMPDHHLYLYFRFLVEHPELLYSELHGKSQDAEREVDGERHNVNDVGGALSLLGSAYGSGEEEDGDENAKTEKDVSQDNSNAVCNIVSHGSKKMESNGDAAIDESISRNTIRSIKEKVLSVKKNSLITAYKSGSVKGITKEGKSGSFSSTVEKAKSSALAMASKIEPLVLEPPSELKSLIDKLVEFIIRNGKQFEATLIEQDTKHGRFPFLLPSNQYHPYYLKVLQTAQEAKTNGKSFCYGKDDQVGRGTDRNASQLKESGFSPLDSAVGDVPLESDRKEKFKMVIGKSKKEAQEMQSKGTDQECGITVDAAAAAAILQAAIRGIDNSNLQTVSNTPLNVHSHVNSSKGNQPASFGCLLLSQPENTDRSESHSASALASKTTVRTSQAARETDYYEGHLTEEQKMKAERLKRAKMFVAMLKSGTMPFKRGASRASSADPLESEVPRSASEVNLTGKKREGSLAPTDVERPAIVEKPERFYFGEEHSERVARRKYRSRSGGCEDVDDDTADKKHEGGLRARYRSRSRRSDEDDKNENGEEMEQNYRKKRQSHSSSDENEDEEESNEEGRDHEHAKVRHQSRHSRQEDDGHEEKHKETKDHKRPRKKHRSHHSSRKRRSSKQCSHEEDERDDDGRDHKHSRKKHCSHRSSYHSREKQRHRNRHSSRDKESQGHLKHDNSSDDEHQDDSSLDNCEKEFYDERDELEEGEISSRVSGGSRGIPSGHGSRETSVDVLGAHQRAPSQPSETVAEVPDDLRAKIRAMLMATRL